MKIRMEKIKTPLIFVAGVVVGIAATWVGFKEKYEQQAQEIADIQKKVLEQSEREEQYDDETDDVYCVHGICFLKKFSK